MAERPFGVRAVPLLGSADEVARAEPIRARLCYELGREHMRRLMALADREAEGPTPVPAIVFRGEADPEADALRRAVRVLLVQGVASWWIAHEHATAAELLDKALESLRTIGGL